MYGDPEDIPLLRDTALSGDDALTMAALKALVLVGADLERLLVEYNSTLETLWRDASFDPMIAIGTLAPDGTPPKIMRGKSTLPPSAWRAVGRTAHDSRAIPAIEAIALAEKGERVRIFAVYSLPHGPANDRFIETLVRTDHVPMLLKAVAYEALSTNSGTYELVASAIQRETSPRVLSGLAIVLVHLTDTSRKGESLKLLKPLLHGGQPDLDVVAAAVEAVSLLDTTDAVAELLSVARDPSSVDRQVLAVGALAFCSMGTAVARDRVEDMRTMLWDPDPTVAASAGAALLYCEGYPPLSEASRGVIDAAVCSRIELLAESPAVERSRRLSLKLQLTRRRSGEK